MKAIRLLSIIAMLVMISFSCSYAKNEPYDIQVRTLYSVPDGATAKAVFQIPVDVRLLDISEDANWYKISTKFYIGPVEFKHSGWAYIPVGNILVERAEKTRVASTSK